MGWITLPVLPCAGCLGRPVVGRDGLERVRTGKAPDPLFRRWAWCGGLVLGAIGKSLQKSTSLLVAVGWASAVIWRRSVSALATSRPVIDAWGGKWCPDRLCTWRPALPSKGKCGALAGAHIGAPLAKTCLMNYFPKRRARGGKKKTSSVPEPFVFFALSRPWCDLFLLPFTMMIGAIPLRFRPVPPGARGRA